MNKDTIETLKKLLQRNKEYNVIRLTANEKQALTDVIKGFNNLLIDKETEYKTEVENETRD